MVETMTKKKTPDAQIKLIPIDQIKPYENNPRIIGEDAVDAVAASIERYGFRGVIWLDKNMEIIAGHTRVQAMQKLGRTEIPAEICEDLTEELVRELRIIDNKANELAKWEFKKLQLEMQTLDLDIQPIQLAFKKLELDIIMQAGWNSGTNEPPDTEGVLKSKYDIKLTQDQYSQIMETVQFVRDEQDLSSSLTDGEVLSKICQEYLADRK